MIRADQQSVSQSFIKYIFATAIAICLFGPYTPANAGSDTFAITSEHNNTVDVEFYSESRNVSWPGGDEVYSIDDYETHYYKLNCRRGEHICYGAGVRNDYNTFWGVGIGNKHRCKDCCYYCEGGQTINIVLNQ